jgi:sec-independent protein translocase protein TatB
LANHKLVVTCVVPGYICAMGFGIGGQEIVVIGLLLLVLFGPSKLSNMARDLGRFVSEARRSVDDFKSELVSGDDEDGNRRPERKR